MSVQLADIRPCLEGAVPSIIATSDLNGTPNVSLVSQVHYMDPRHVALTFQFFNKTRRNISENGQATVYVTDPDTAAQYRLLLLFRESRTDGVLFRTLKAKLAGLASHTGMTGIFRLRGADVYQVLDIECVVPGNPLLRKSVPPALPALNALVTALAGAGDLAALFELVVTRVATTMEIPRLALLLVDETGEVLYTVASNSTAASGVGAEVPVGVGLVGLCAQEQVPVRVAFGAAEYSYRNAIEQNADIARPGWLETAIDFPELSAPQSQLAVPVLGAGTTLQGVLYAESDSARRFSYDDEDALMVLSRVLAMRMDEFRQRPPDVQRAEDDTPMVPDGEPVQVRYFASNHSVFVDHDYLIKGVAGAILWRILEQHREDGRDEFSNRELRLDARLGLPEIGDNLEARLVLLQKRLAEKSDAIAIEKTGRGRFRLRLLRPVSLHCSDSD